MTKDYYVREEAVKQGLDNAKIRDDQTNADCHKIIAYAAYYKFKLPDEMMSAIEAFEKDETEANKEAFKIELCRLIVTSTHESFNDSLWEFPKKAARELLDSKNIKYV